MRGRDLDTLSPGHEWPIWPEDDYPTGVIIFKTNRVFSLIEGIFYNKAWVPSIRAGNGITVSKVCPSVQSSCISMREARYCRPFRGDRRSILYRVLIRFLVFGLSCAGLDYILEPKLQWDARRFRMFRSGRVVRIDEARIQLLLWPNRW